MNFSDGFFTDTSNIPAAIPGETQTLIDLYAAKHDPFVYFRSVEEHQIDHIVGFEGKRGLYDDLASGDLPEYSFIAPNQCNDQHGRGNAGPQCADDPNDNGTQTGLNPALIFLGDQALRTIVKAIKASPVWSKGRNRHRHPVGRERLQLLSQSSIRCSPSWTRTTARTGVQSNNFYTHFSLLRTIEGGLGLPCLNHACDANTKVMSDLFAAGKDNDRDNDRDDDSGHGNH